MESFSIGKVYTLNVDFIHELNDGRKYIYFQETNNGKQLRVKAFDFLTQPDADLPSTIDVKVHSIDPMSGMPLLKVDHNWLVSVLYKGEKFPKILKFSVVAKYNQSNYQSLLVKDSYGMSHYFPITGDDSLDNYSEGESLTLVAESIETNKRGCLFVNYKNTPH